MRIAATAAAALAVTVITATAAVAGVASASASASAKSRTCAAFTAWNASRTSARLNVVMTDSESVPWTSSGVNAWIASDAVVLYTDVRSGAGKYVKQDAKDFRADCAK